MMRMGASSTQQGVALLIVLWVVAGLSIFVTSLGSSIQQEAAVTATGRNILEGRAIGEAAIYQVLPQLVADGSHEMQMRSQTPTNLIVQDTQVELQVTPWSGLININTASVGVLTALLEKAAGIAPGQAQQIAIAVAQARAGAQSTKPRLWESTEDLLSLQLLSYPIYSAISPYLVADSQDNAAVNLSVAPEPLRTWLGAQTQGVIRDAVGATEKFRIIAAVHLQDKGVVYVQRHFTMQSVGAGQLPWALISAKQTWSPDQGS